MGEKQPFKLTGPLSETTHHKILTSYNHKHSAVNLWILALNLPIHSNIKLKESTTRLHYFVTGIYSKQFQHTLFSVVFKVFFFSVKERMMGLIIDCSFNYNME